MALNLKAWLTLIAGFLTLSHAVMLYGRPVASTTSYTYDLLHRLKTVTPGADPVRTYAYDDAGQLLSVTETGQPAANVAYTYDALGRILTETSRGQTHHYAYDKVGSRTQAIYESKVVDNVETGRTVATTYDALNRPLTITEGGRVTQYGYDKAGRAMLLVAGNGQVTANNYDRLGRLVKRRLYASTAGHAAQPPTGLLTEFEWSHDALGNVTAQSEKWPGSVDASRSAVARTTAMHYDGANRLETEVVSDPVAGVTTTAYTYDAANNRDSKTVTGGSEPGYWTYHYNGANQLTSWKKYTAENGTELRDATLAYDDNGNRTSQIIGGTADSGGVNPPNKANGTTSYTWDNTNRLASVTMPDGKQFSYTYDYRMRRVATHASGTGVTPKHTSIVFSGGLSVSEYESASAPGSGGVPAATAPVVQYQRGPDMGGGIGGMLYSLRDSTSSGTLTPKYSLNNGRGDIVAQSDQAATLTWTASYEAHGRRTVETGVNEDKQRANSKDEDPTGLLNEGWRYRDLETGVWLSRDPAGFVDGPNLYAYVKQNPWTAFDPDGLAEVRYKYYSGEGGKGMRRLEADPDNDRKPLIKNVGGVPHVQVNHYDTSTALHFWTNYQGERKKTTWEPASKYGEGLPVVDTAKRNYITKNDPSKSLDAWGKAANSSLVNAMDTASKVSVEVSTQILTAGVFSGISAMATAANTSKAETLVIGRLKDLEKLGPNEKSFVGQLPYLGSPKLNWKQNAGMLRQEMKKGNPIRDASSMLDNSGQFLNAERYLLRDRGWKFDSSTSMWMPPLGKP